SMPDGRCEVILYTPDHDATFPSLGLAGARRVVDLWARRSAALAARPEIAYVLVFENRGAEVGATIPHPHGQIYAFDFVPELPLRELEQGGRFDDPADRLVATSRGWRAWGPAAPPLPPPLPPPPKPVRAAPAPTSPRSTTPAAKVSQRCSSTCSRRSIGSSAGRRRTCCGSTSGPSTEASGRTRGCTSRSSRLGELPACSGSSPPASSAPASTST